MSSSNLNRFPGQREGNGAMERPSGDDTQLMKSLLAAAASSATRDQKRSSSEADKAPQQQRITQGGGGAAPRASSGDQPSSSRGDLMSLLRNLPNGHQQLEQSGKQSTLQTSVLESLRQRQQQQQQQQQLASLLMLPSGNMSSNNGNDLTQTLLNMLMSSTRQQQQQQQHTNPGLPAVSNKDSTEPSSSDQSAKYSSSSRTNSGAETSSSSDQNGIVKTIMPCRARGMKMEHNFQTAFFEISQDIKHGDGLICSFPQCRNKGIKFLYCAFCKGPVAKRNFRNAHTHPEIQSETSGSQPPMPHPPQKSLPENKSKRGAPISTFVSVPKHRKLRDQKQQHASMKSPPSSMEPRDSRGATTTSSRQQAYGQSQADSAVTNSGSNDTSSDKIATGKSKPGGGENLLQKDHNSAAATSLLLDQAGKERRAAWERLLVSRPNSDQSDETSRWLMRVMAVSDLKSDLKGALSDPQPGSSQQESSETSSISRTTGDSTTLNEEKDSSSNTEGSSSSTSNDKKDSSSSNGESNSSDENNAKPKAKQRNGEEVACDGDSSDEW